MGIYLPTIAFLIEPSEIPKKPVATYNDVLSLLTKYEKEFYRCTTKGYHHLELFRQMIIDFDLPKADFYQKECAVASHKDCIQLHHSLNTIAQFILNDAHLLVDKLIKQEQNSLKTLLHSTRLNQKTKENYRKSSMAYIKEFTNFSFAQYFTAIKISQDISLYDQTEAYGDNEYKILIHWFKTQLYVLEKAVTENKALIHLMITP